MTRALAHLSPSLPDVGRLLGFIDASRFLDRPTDPGVVDNSLGSGSVFAKGKDLFALMAASSDRDKATMVENGLNTRINDWFEISVLRLKVDEFDLVAHLQRFLFDHGVGSYKSRGRCTGCPLRADR